jgi:pimeloyl-ACP methyl ester carboxylesterase
MSLAPLRPKFYEPTHHFVTSDGIRINFIDATTTSTRGGAAADARDNMNSRQDEGQQTKDTILLIHGLMCSTRMWQPPYGPKEFIDSLLDKGFRVVALDCRGHGKSDKPTGEPNRYGLRIIEDLVELLDYLKISCQVCVVG